MATAPKAAKNRHQLTLIDITLGVTSSYIGYTIYICTIFSSTTNQTWRRLYPKQNRLAWLFIRGPMRGNWCLLNKRVNVSYNSRELAVMHDGKSERNRGSRNSRDRLSAWLGAWESCPEISRWRHLIFRYAFGRSVSFFGAAPSHPADSYTFIYRYYIRLSVCVIISANWTVSFECELLSVSSVCLGVSLSPLFAEFNWHKFHFSRVRPLFATMTYTQRYPLPAYPTININKDSTLYTTRFVTFSREICRNLA